MDIVWVVVGLVILAAVFLDLFATTLAAGSGADPFTRRFGQAVATAMLIGCRDTSSRRRHAVGPAVLVATAVSWIVGLTIGWTFVLAPIAMSDASSGVPVTLTQRIAFTLSSLSSLGPGYTTPASSVGLLLTAVMSLTGLGLITLSITYVLPVVTAVSHRRVQAMAISDHGTSVAELVTSLRADRDGALHLVRSMTDEVRLLTQRHLAYPVLHHFQATSRAAAYAPNLAAFDQAVRVLAADGRLPRFAAHSFHAAVDGLLAVTAHHLDVDAVAPASSTTVREERLAAFVRDAGWPWDAAT